MRVRRDKRWAGALAGGLVAGAANLALISLLANAETRAPLVRVASAGAATPALTMASPTADSPPVAVRYLSATELARVETELALISNDGPAPGLRLPDGLGAGLTAANRGSGEGGPTTVMNRRDDGMLRAGVLSDPDGYQKSSLGGGRADSSPEAIDRAPNPGAGDRGEQRRRAAAGLEQSRAGTAVGIDGFSPRAPATSTSDPDEQVAARIDDEVSITADPRLATERVAGTVDVPSALYADRGAPATDQPQRGPAQGRTLAAVASDATQPMPFDLGQPSHGGDRIGVVAPGTSIGASATFDGRGSGAFTTTATAEVAGAVRAARSDPYFRSLYRRLDREIVFPREMALALEQGDVIVSFVLSPEGEPGDIKIHRKSRNVAFDREVIRGIAAAGPFGPVPARLMGGRPALRVEAFYAFKNPMIR